MVASPGRKLGASARHSDFAKSPSPTRKPLSKKKKAVVKPDDLTADDLRVEQIEDNEGPVNSQELIASGSSKGFAALAKQSAARPDSAASAAPKVAKGRKS